MSGTHRIKVTVNGKLYEAEVESRRLLVDFLRHELMLYGTHAGCEQGACGACTVQFDGRAIKSCLMLAIQADGHEITTVEGLAKDGVLHDVQEAFRNAHGLQCGFCTPGILMSLIPFLDQHPAPTEDEIRDLLGGHLCRCTGYFKIIEAVKLAAGAAKAGA